MLRTVKTFTGYSAYSMNKAAEDAHSDMESFLDNESLEPVQVSTTSHVTASEDTYTYWFTLTVVFAG